jgi:hypothetical protein
MVDVNIIDFGATMDRPLFLAVMVARIQLSISRLNVKGDMDKNCSSSIEFDCRRNEQVIISYNCCNS